jgi:secreted Zn-dependent insulinase-like peptidase
VQLLFEYIQMLKDAKTQEWIFKEIQQVDATDFRFKEKEVLTSLPPRCVATRMLVSVYSQLPALCCSRSPSIM